jgi:hypothetical protein
MEAASNPSTFGLASRIRPIFYPICVLLQDNRSEADGRPRHRTCDLDGVWLPRSTSAEAFQRGQDLGVWLGLIHRQYSTSGS